MARFSRELELLEVEHERRRDDYMTLARELRRVLDEDPAFPVDRLTLSRVRYKRVDRLKEKVTQLRRNREPVDSTNYADYVVDLLGVRYITLGIADRLAVCRFIQDAARRQQIVIVRQKVMDSFEQQAFGAAYPESAEIIDHPLGYTSVHYWVRLHPGVASQPSLAELNAEIQVRTILEEAWAEVDHRYRYELNRSNKDLPSYVSSGFTDLSHLFHAVARMQESLCVAAERHAMPGGEVPPSEETELAGVDEAAVRQDRDLRQMILRRLSIDLAPVSVGVLERDLARHLERQVAVDELAGWLDEHKISFLRRCEQHGLRNLLDPVSAGFEEVHMCFLYCGLMGIGRQQKAVLTLRNGVRDYLD